MEKRFEEALETLIKEVSKIEKNCQLQGPLKALYMDGIRQGIRLAHDNILELLEGVAKDRNNDEILNHIAMVRKKHTCDC